MGCREAFGLVIGREVERACECDVPRGLGESAGVDMMRANASPCGNAGEEKHWGGEGCRSRSRNQSRKWASCGGRRLAKGRSQANDVVSRRSDKHEGHTRSAPRRRQPWVFWEAQSTEAAVPDSVVYSSAPANSDVVNVPVWAAAGSSEIKEGRNGFWYGVS